MKAFHAWLRLAGLAVCLITSVCIADSSPDRVIIVRHGEKLEDGGDNLSCQGLNRALQLPGILMKKFGKPNKTYVPALNKGDSTKHARMFQTVTPFAVAQNLKIDSSFQEDDTQGVAKDVKKQQGTVLLVWEHSQIQALAQALGAKGAPSWPDNDFDSIWILKYNSKAETSKQPQIDSEGLSPSKACP